jgi:6,7-dimethyl-8-ribityllumazine synthase
MLSVTGQALALTALGAGCARTSHVPKTSRHHGRVAILVSRYNEVITSRLLDGALACCDDAGVPRDEVDVVWLPGAFELTAAAAAAAATGRYTCLVALGAVIRGETPHFEYVAGAAATGLTDVSRLHAIPVGFGVLTRSVSRIEPRSAVCCPSPRHPSPTGLRNAP